MGIATESRTDGQFIHLADAARAHFERIFHAHGPSLFTVAVERHELFETYLATLPEEARQEHNCSCCRDFLRQYGNLVAITKDGRQVSAMWNPDAAPELYRDAVALMARTVEGAKVTGVFISSEGMWGEPQAGGFSHFAVEPMTNQIYRRSVSSPMTARQKMAVKREDYRTLQRGLAEFSRDTVAQAITLLDADALSRGEKVIGPVRWLLNLIDATADKHGRAKENVTWLAVAGAPVGFCQPRSTMAGTLLEDIAAGMSFDEVRRRFESKMHPLRYQRPQAAPSAGNIQQAEKLVKELGIDRALQRRFARLDELKTIWRPTEPAKPAAESKGGVFGHLQPKGAVTPAPMDMDATDITWVKFAKKVLPDAKQIEFLVNHNRANFTALLTAVHDDAPAIIQWDDENERNPFSHYVYNGGSSPEMWGLRAGEYVKVTGITPKPAKWAGEDKYPNQSNGVVLVLEGAVDSRDAGLALFPEILKSGLHHVRSTIEAYSNSGKLEGRDEASACGMMIFADAKCAHVVRVTTSTGIAKYRITSFD